jgi:alanine dehydrogenase
MRIGVPKEVKDHEDRVGLVPSSVAELVHHGDAVNRPICATSGVNGLFRRNL